MKEGWLIRQLKTASREFAVWPAWMKRTKADIFPKHADEYGCCSNCGTKIGGKK